MTIGAPRELQNVSGRFVVLELHVVLVFDVCLTSHPPQHPPVASILLQMPGFHSSLRLTNTGVCPYHFSF